MTSPAAEDKSAINFQIILPVTLVCDTVVVLTVGGLRVLMGGCGGGVGTFHWVQGAAVHWVQGCGVRTVVH